MLCVNIEKMYISYQPKNKYENIYKDFLFNDIRNKISDYVSNNSFESISSNNKILFIAFPLKRDCDIHKLKKIISEYNEKSKELSINE
ncbi:hypothetical protein [Campylobacter sp. RM12651]|uniref:hypothetical protein n=1 Tax=Campylobacter sp. RM12651 TaxID=1660079 RepID=UPI001EFB5637|nr:hypothetical protein [Campylobacter sp. RM12651]ULO03781.1 hypothetical protein AVBRAN_1327 [Campylobacter sp. RM12651]